MRRGLFIAVEGIDGSGKSTQITTLQEIIRSLNKYNNVLITREPTANCSEVRRRLEQDGDACSGQKEMTRLYVQDRIEHTRDVIVPALNQGIYVISDRYRMSTDAFQSAQRKLDLESRGLPPEAQDLSLEELFALQNRPEILVPDLTFLLLVSPEIALERIIKRGQQSEKFEKLPFMIKYLLVCF